MARHRRVLQSLECLQFNDRGGRTLRFARRTLRFARRTSRRPIAVAGAPY